MERKKLLIYTHARCVGPMSRSPGIDFTGTASGAQVHYYALMYFALVAGAFLGRARQLRSN